MLCSIAEKLDDVRKKKLEDMIAAAKSGKCQGGGATAAAAPAPAVGAAKACFPMGIRNHIAPNHGAAIRYAHCFVFIPFS